MPADIPCIFCLSQYQGLYERHVFQANFYCDSCSDKCKAECWPLPMMDDHLKHCFPQPYQKWNFRVSRWHQLCKEFHSLVTFVEKVLCFFAYRYLVILKLYFIKLHLWRTLLFNHSITQWKKWKHTWLWHASSVLLQTHHTGPLLQGVQKVC